MSDLTYPRLLYRGPADDTAETCAVATAVEGTAALKSGWRTTRAIAGKPAKNVDEPKAVDPPRTDPPADPTPGDHASTVPVIPAPARTPTAKEQKAAAKAAKAAHKKAGTS